MDGGASGLPLFTNRHKPSAILRGISAEQTKMLLGNSISPLPLHKTLVLLEVLTELEDARFANHERLALASALVSGISNLHFGPEVGVGPAKADAAVLSLWLNNVRAMASGLSRRSGPGS